MNTNENVAKLYSDYVLSTYGREGIAFYKGEGSYLIDMDGNRYLDMYPGWGTGCLGHSHPYLADQLCDQLHTLIHVPNNFYNPLQAELAKRLADYGFGGYTFFCNSGAEANEAAIKLARRFGNQTGGRFEIITFYKSFHGRTLAAITATGQPKYQQGFEPLPAGFKYAEFGNFESVMSLVTDKTCAIMLELIQGEGGLNIAQDNFYRQIESLCREKNILLIADEVQTGIGRTGNIYGFQTFGVSPDVVTLAKALGGGVPIGAMMAKPALKDMLPPGMHASTFGGNSFACRAALAVFDVIEKENLLNNVKELSEYAFARFNDIARETGLITAIRGKGLMFGVDITVASADVKAACREKFVLINNVGEKTIRFLPALNITGDDLKKGIDVFEQALLREGKK